jgi:hypothetical protein
MDDELQKLEAELKQLRPLSPGSAWQTRLARELGASAPAQVPQIGFRWWWVALPAAAAVALVFNYRLRDPAAAAQPVASFKPVAAENVLYAAADEGLITLDDGTPARRERLHFVDTITWRNPRTNASLVWSVPREEVRIVPVRFQ